MNRKQGINKFYSLIRKLEEYKGKDISPKRLEKYVRDISDTIDNTLPKYLYKYRNVNQMHIDSLREETLFLSKPAAFNDPTESIAYVDPNELVQHVLMFPNDAPVFNKSDVEDAKDNFMLKRTEILNTGLSYIQQNRERVKILCLSETIDSPLMWSHYASEHRGFAVRYATEFLDIPECKNCNDCRKCLCRRPGKPIFPVIYKDSRYNASTMAVSRALYLDLNNGVDDHSYPFPLLSVLQKSKSWSYEKEWRIVCDNPDSSYFTFKPDAIFLGVRVKLDIALDLARIAKEKSISLYKMDIDYFDREFKLIYSDWSGYSEEDISEAVNNIEPNFG